MTYKSPISMISRLVVIGAFITIVLPLLAAPADLDPTWDEDGIVITDLDGSGLNTEGVAFILPKADGRITAVGSRRTGDVSGPLQLAFAQYTADGVLDATFGDEGVFIAPNITPSERPMDAAFQADGKIITSFQPVGSGNFKNFMVARWTESGTLDSSFGTEGIVQLDIANLATGLDNVNSTAHHLAIQPDGGILVTSFATDYTYDIYLELVVRLNSDGSLDLTFGENGILNIKDFTPEFFDLSTHELLLDSDGRILVVGNGWFTQDDISRIHYTFVSRFLADGTIDSSFADGGVFITSLYGTETGVNLNVSDFTGYGVLTPDGHLILSGMADDYNFSPPRNRMYLARLTPDGILDTSFGDNGIALTEAPGIWEGYADMELLADGKILQAGGTRTLPYLIRYNSDGTLDDDWYGTGIHSFDLYPGVNAFLMQAQRDGRIYVRLKGPDFAIARLINEPALVEVSRIPAHLSQNVARNASLQLTFAEPVSINSGAVEIRRTVDSSLFERIPVTDNARITGSSTNTITINPTSNFEPNTSYFVLVDLNSFTNASGHPFYGVREQIEWHFTSGESPSNTAPELVEVGAKSVEAGQVLTFNVSASDGDLGQSLTFSLDNGTSGSVPEGAEITAGGEFSWTPTEAQVGQHTFDVVVTDNGEPNMSDFETITVTVTAAPVEPPTELLTNRGFENKSPNNPKRATKWTVNKLVTTDGRVCNKTKPPTIYAYAGKCAFQFQSSAAKARYIEQKMPLTEALADQTMRVAGYVKRKGLTAGAAIQVQITYADNSKATLKIAIPGGTKGYKLLENTLVLQKDAKRARVRITSGQSKGQLLVDSLSLTVGEEAPLTVGNAPILLPDAPDLRGN